ncbi:MAG: hypothetical protein QM767_19070 [Anaeromyxobacter sp.]
MNRNAFRRTAVLAAFTVLAAGCGGSEQGDPAAPATFDGAPAAATAADWQRTVIFVQGQTADGQDLFIRGGIDHDVAKAKLGLTCTSTNYACAIPIRHRNTRNATTNPWKTGDTMLDWYGAESGQTGVSHNIVSQGTPADWTTNTWPGGWGAVKTVAVDGYGVEPLNTYGAHYWMVDVDMDCSKAYQAADGTRWFEVKSYISNGPGWEGNVAQGGTPYASINHMARCGQINVFSRGSSAATFASFPVWVDLPSWMPNRTETAALNLCPEGVSTCTAARTTTLKWTLNGQSMGGYEVMPSPANVQPMWVSGWVYWWGPYSQVYAAQATLGVAAGVTLDTIGSFGTVPVWGGTTNIPFTGASLQNAHGISTVIRSPAYTLPVTDAEVAAFSETIYVQEVALLGITPPNYRAFYSPADISMLAGHEGNVSIGNGEVSINWGNPGFASTYPGGIAAHLKTEFAHEHAHTIFNAIYSQLFTADNSCLNEGLADAVANYLGYRPESEFKNKRGTDYSLSQSCAALTEMHDVGDCIFWHLKHLGEASGAASGPYWNATTMKGLFTPKHTFTANSCTFGSQLSGDSYVVYLSEATGADMTSFVTSLGFPTSGSLAASRAALGF